MERNSKGNEILVDDSLSRANHTRGNKVIFLIFVLFTRTLYNSIHAVQSFFFGTLHFVVYPRKKMPACPHLVSVEEINAEEIRKKMTEVSNLVSIQNDYSFSRGNQFFAWS